MNTKVKTKVRSAKKKDEAIKTVVRKDVLARAIGVASKAVSPNPVIPLLGNLLFEAKNGTSRVAATNYEIGVSCSFPSQGSEFTTCIPAKTFSNLVDVLHVEELEIELNPFDQSAMIMTETSTSNIRCASADEFPDIPKVTTPQFSVPVGQFKEMVERVAFASNPNAENILAGVQLKAFGKLFVMFATDGYHLSYEEFPIKQVKKAVDIIVKGTTLEMISRMFPDEGEVQIQAEENKVLFHCGSVDVVTQLLDGNYPDYNMLKNGIGKTNTEVAVSTIELFRACRQLKVFAVDSGQSKLDIKGMLIRYSVVAQDKGDSDITLSAVKKGNDLTVGINVHFLYEFLEICKSQQVRIEFAGNEFPIVFRMQGYSDFYHIIMPVAL